MVTYHWMNLDENGNELPEDEFLEHVSDHEILSLMDSYDDGRISKLCMAYVNLRLKAIELLDNEFIAAYLESDR